VQVIKTFGIRDIFREAISSCTDIDHSEFPLLSKNKLSGAGNVSKITGTVHKRIMIYIAQLYLACEMMKKLKPKYRVPSFNFLSFPQLNEMFRSIESHLKKPVSGLKTERDSKEKASVLVEDLRKTVSSCRKSLHTVMDGLAGIEAKLKSVEKKVKGLEKEKSMKVPGSEEFANRLWSALVEKKKKKKKRKEKRKRRRSEEEAEQKKKKGREESE
jgi:hypothetical protein